MGALETVIERTQDFTDSAYTTHEHRENILLLCDRAKLELNALFRIGNNMVSDEYTFIRIRIKYIFYRIKTNPIVLFSFNGITNITKFNK